MGTQHVRVKQYAVSTELLDLGVPIGGGPCKCTAVCCGGGVYADVAERDRILAHREMIKKYMDETQTTDESRWFEHLEFNDADFPSGRCVGTTEINNKCAFLNRQGWCSLQVTAVQEGMHKWALKPLFCVLFPIEISDGVVSFDDMLQKEESCCTVGDEFDIPLFEACKDELTHLFGDDGYQEIASHYRSRQKSVGIHTPVGESL